MGRVLRTAPANADLVEIWDYVASDNLDAADRLIERIVARCELLSDHPESGSIAVTLDQALPSDLRFVAVGNYVIFYRPLRDGIVVYRVLHAARDFPAIFRERP